MTPHPFTDLEEITPNQQAEEALNHVHSPRLKALLIALHQHLAHTTQLEKTDSGCG